ncbi:hypothetical protein [Chelativorans sp. AA-79]|uniref:hypothetical protein n=1 Tax=Chelativorans sp. AA-79 TaxID=3028735 RepID=UPI0023F7390D|nr:hypothetical protein [Chelativorans sp. AA-79]WEX11145.1 hypothetical protein PVE73_09525 [Chelativorans sp. AA-79]
MRLDRMTVAAAVLSACSVPILAQGSIGVEVNVTVPKKAAAELAAMPSQVTSYRLECCIHLPIQT